MLRYPGAVFTDPNAGTALNSTGQRLPGASPRGHSSSQSRGRDGEHYLGAGHRGDQVPGESGTCARFQISSPQRGMVALRINYPLSIGVHERLSTAAGPVVAARSGKPTGSH